MNYLLKSKRLGFRKWLEKDIEPFSSMNADKEVMEYFPNTLSKTESIQFIEAIQKKFDHDGYALYAVEELKSQEFIGFIGFWRPSIELRTQLGIDPFVEIGWRLRKESWNKGYATEGAKACLDFGFNQLNLKEIYSFTTKVNLRSESVMQKIGMQKVQEFDYPNLNTVIKPHVLYRLTEHEYKKLKTTND